MSEPDDAIEKPPPASKKSVRQRKPNARRQARTLALQILYETDQTDHDSTEVL